MGENTRNLPFRTIPAEQAVGTTLAHDMTQIIPGKFKGSVFKKGYKISSGDLCRLMRIDKNNFYILDLADDQMHEDDAALELAYALSGAGIIFSGSPKEGKLELRAAYPGLFKVNIQALQNFNMFQDMMCASNHTNTSVKTNQSLPATRAIPLVIHKSDLEKTVNFARENYPVFSVKLFNPLKIRLIITGDEVYKGLIRDKFQDIVKQKITTLRATLEEIVILPDSREMISHQIGRYLEKDTDLIITTGGMSVDPDDMIKAGIEDSKFEEIHYSAAVLPGAMFLLGYHKNIAIMGLPSCGLYHKTTLFDLILPRLMAGEKPGLKNLARLSHGGLCLNCKPSKFPACSFEKAG